MKSKKKLIILTSIILGVLVVVLALTYAAFTYDRTGNTSELVLGDIYMHYRENNQLILNNAMPTSIDKYTTYKVNPVMATQEVDNELTRCVDLLRGIALTFDEGSDAETFCRGTGTAGDKTFQQLSDLTPAEYQHQDFLDAGVIIQDGERYVVNPVMATQEVMDNELTRCVNFLTSSGMPLSSGTMEDFCKGTGTTMNNYTFQENLNNGDFFPEFIVSEIASLGIILPHIENLPYFEFTISGKNTYLDEDIWFEIVLNHGDNHETRNTRIRDELLRFTLVEVVGEDTKTTLFNNRKYNDLSNKRIWVETIKANTTSEINKTYRLYAWISDETVIGNVNEDYTTEEWNDVFASIKVNVTGDFNEKELQLEYEEMYDVTDASCFETEEIKTYTINQNMTDEELNACVTIHHDEIGWIPNEDEDWESYCQGTGTLWGDTFEENLGYRGRYSSSELNILEENNVIDAEIFGIEIMYYDINCGTDIVIPEKINNYNVVEINSNAFWHFDRDVDAPRFKVTIPDTITSLPCLENGIVTNPNPGLVCVEPLE